MKLGIWSPYQNDTHTPEITRLVISCLPVSHLSQNFRSRVRQCETWGHQCLVFWVDSGKTKVHNLQLCSIGHVFKDQVLQKASMISKNTTSTFSNITSINQVSTVLFLVSSNSQQTELTKSLLQLHIPSIISRKIVRKLFFIRQIKSLQFP